MEPWNDQGIKAWTIKFTWYEKVILKLWNIIQKIKRKKKPILESMNIKVNRQGYIIKDD